MQTSGTFEFTVDDKDTAILRNVKVRAKYKIENGIIMIKNVNGWEVGSIPQGSKIID